MDKCFTLLFSGSSFTLGLVSDQWFEYLIRGILFKHDLLFLAGIRKQHFVTRFEFLSAVLLNIPVFLDFYTCRLVQSDIHRSVSKHLVWYPSKCQYTFSLISVEISVNICQLTCHNGSEDSNLFLKLKLSSQSRIMDPRPFVASLSGPHEYFCNVILIPIASSDFWTELFVAFLFSSVHIRKYGSSNPPWFSNDILMVPCGQNDKAMSMWKSSGLQSSCF
jgi:hypothetical protein